MSALADIARTIRDRRAPGELLIVGITGAVAAGKSTLAGQLTDLLASDGVRVETIATDGFLMPNARLTELGILGEKGFPPSYDNPAFRAALSALRAGPAAIPAYSHVLYDIDPALTRTLDPPDILLVEGLNLHHRAAAPDQPDPLDLLIYLDAEEADLEAWYVARFLELWAAAEHDPTSFYARFRAMDRDQTAALAKQVWDGVNLKNLRENIVLALAGADLVVRKGPDHRIVDLEIAG